MKLSSPTLTLCVALTASTVSAQTVTGALPRIASVNVCADQLVMLLAQPQQIASISNLALQQSGSYFHERASRYPINEGLAEQVLAVLPDRVIVGEYSARYTVDMLKQQKVQVDVLPIARSVDDILANIQRVAEWVGQTDKGEQIVASMQQRLKHLQEVTGSLDADSPVAAVFDPNGYTSGSQTLRGQLLALAGWRNLADDFGISSYGRMTLETLLIGKPDAIISSPYNPGTYSRAQVQATHPVLAAQGLDALRIDIPSRMTICEGPWSLDVVEQLQKERQRWSSQSADAGGR